MNEWTIDKDNSILMHELYKDLRRTGVAENTQGRIYGNRPSDRFDDGWKNILDANFSKYERMSKLALTIKDSIVSKRDGSLTLKVDLAPHAVKLIELIPN
jgi:hypothetical protein